jgi:hypothetical protein
VLHRVLFVVFGIVHLLIGGASLVVPEAFVSTLTIEPVQVGFARLFGAHVLWLGLLGFAAALVEAPRSRVVVTVLALVGAAVDIAAHLVNAAAGLEPDAAVAVATVSLFIPFMAWSLRHEMLRARAVSR